MRRSKLFIKTKREAPADETALNARLLTQAGYVHKEMAGVYDYLPLGLIVLNKTIAIIREEMNAIGGSELLMSSLQEKELWSSTGRWDDKTVDTWFKTKLQNNTELGLGWTHEEPITRLMRQHLASYKDLPVYPYQFQTKFRNELRSQSGIMRCREFIMKDLYSFSRNQEEHDEFYEKCKAAYLRIFQRVGLGGETYLTFASGGSFSKFSHEFQTVTDVGEDTIYVHEGRKLAINKEVYTPEVLKELNIEENDLRERKGVEVGNIFTLGTRFSEPLGLTYTDEHGQAQPVIMGCYGIGPGRLMGTVVEHLADERGLVWPRQIAPFSVYLAALGSDEKVKKTADELYKILTDAGIETFYDDRESTRPGEVFADADLLGMPYRLVVSEKSLSAGGAELKKRTETEVRVVPSASVTEVLAKALQA